MSLDLEQRVLQSAGRLLREHGAGFTMDQLEAASNVSRATIYRRIGGKSELLAKLAERHGMPLERTDIRSDILDAAGEVSARHGFAAATMEQIAERARVGVATVYRHFGDKESLLAAYVEERTPREAVREMALHPTDDVRADLEAIVARSLEFFHQHRDIFRMLFMGSEAERRYLQHLRGRSDTTLERLTAYFAAQREAGRIDRRHEPEELGLALIGLILSFAMIGPHEYGTSLADTEATAVFLVGLFLDGARPRPNSGGEGP